MPSITPELARIWQRIQVCLLPGVEECLDDALTQRLKQLITSLEILRIEEHVAAPAQSARGRPLQALPVPSWPRPSTTCLRPIC